jgi:hypothetical protein
MMKLIMLLAVGSVGLTACGNSGGSTTSLSPKSQTSVSAPVASSRAYDSSQRDVFRVGLQREFDSLPADSLVGIGEIDWTPITDAAWAPIEDQARKLCDDAELFGWDSAIGIYRNFLMTSGMAAAEASGLSTGSDSRQIFQDLLDEMVPLTVKAVTAVGSFCPDIPNTPVFVNPKDEIGVSGMATKGAEDEFVVAFRRDPILRAIVSDSTDQQIIAMSVPVCVSKQDYGYNRRKNIDSYIEIGIAPLFAERIVDLSLEYICP